MLNCLGIEKKTDETSEIKREIKHLKKELELSTPSTKYYTAYVPGVTGVIVSSQSFFPDSNNINYEKYNKISDRIIYLERELESLEKNIEKKGNSYSKTA